MSEVIPQYLTPPEPGAETYGRVVWENGSWFVLDAPPAVRELAKRVFPGCAPVNGTMLSFPDTRRMVGELNWFLLRYPMEVQDRKRFEASRDQAVAHALRRDANLNPAPAKIPAEFRGELLPFQQEGVTYLLANERALLADQMGLGKTVEAIAGMAAGGEWPALVVTPAGNVQRQWQAMLGQFLDLSAGRNGRLFSGTPVHIISGLRPYPLPDAMVYLIHYGLLRGWRGTFRRRRFPTVVFDEVQELRHLGTQKYSAATLVAGGARYVWGLSGTPIYGYGVEMWSVMNVLDYHCLGDRDSFTREWCTGYGSRVVAQPDTLSDHLKREGLMLRRLKKEVQAQLPPKRRVVQVVGKDEGVYTTLIAEAVRLSRAYEGMAFTERGQAIREIDQKSRLAAGVAKAPYVAEFVRTLVEAGEAPLVFSWHHAVHDHLAEALKEFRPGRITGKQTPTERTEAVEAFDKGKSGLVLLSLRTTAGLDGLQGRATCVVFAELDWSPAVHTQCEDRVQRMGVNEALQNILCYYLISDTGYDEVVREALGLKIGQFTGIMGDEPESREDREEDTQIARQHLARIVEVLKAKAG